MSVVRPKYFKDIVGQNNIIRQLKIAIKSAKDRNDSIPHVLLDGLPGSGKTTLAMAIATELDAACLVANGGNLKTVKKIIPYICSIKRHCVFFIDEIHRLPIQVEEFLYPVMEDFRADIGGEEVISIPLPKFTLIGATTITGLLSIPLLDRFQLKFSIEPYSVAEMVHIILNNAKQLSIKIDSDLAQNFAQRCRGTPRLAISILLQVRDYCHHYNTSQVTAKILDEVMAVRGIDSNGLNEKEREYLRILKDVGGPVSLKTLAHALRVDASTVESVIEPYLIQNKLILRTPSGRILRNDN